MYIHIYFFRYINFIFFPRQVQGPKLMPGAGTPPRGRDQGPPPSPVMRGRDEVLNHRRLGGLLGGGGRRCRSAGQRRAPPPFFLPVSVLPAPPAHVTCYVSAGGRRGSAGAGTAAGGRRRGGRGPAALTVPPPVPFPSRWPPRPAAARPPARLSPAPRRAAPGGKMWVKLCCLLLYFLALFVLARVFEAVAWYESGFLATQLVDPVALSFRKLRTILECRGLGHSGLPEKKDVRELVEKSGTPSIPGDPPGGEGGRSPATPAWGGGSPVTPAWAPAALGMETRAPLPTLAGQRLRGVNLGSEPVSPAKDPDAGAVKWRKAGGKLGDGDVKNLRGVFSPKRLRGGKASVRRVTQKWLFPVGSAGLLRAPGVRVARRRPHGRGRTSSAAKKEEERIQIHEQWVSVYSCGQLFPCIPLPTHLLVFLQLLRSGWAQREAVI